MERSDCFGSLEKLDGWCLRTQPEMTQDRLSLLCPDRAAQPGPAEQTEQSESVLTPQRWTNRETGTGDGQLLIRAPTSASTHGSSSQALLSSHPLAPALV